LDLNLEGTRKTEHNCDPTTSNQHSVTQSVQESHKCHNDNDAD